MLFLLLPCSKFLSAVCDVVCPPNPTPLLLKPVKLFKSSKKSHFITKALVTLSYPLVSPSPTRVMSESAMEVVEQVSSPDEIDIGLPWIEKYRPKSLSELIAHEEIVNICRFSFEMLCVHSY